jgi:WD40 repeat protein
MYHKGAIEGSPLQAYASALLFSPVESLVRKLYKHEEPAWVAVKPTMGDNWSACLQTLEGHSSGVTSVAFSHDSTKLASASDDKTVKVWDASSGACLHTLEGHSDWVHSAAFSHDSTKLASASDDETVKVWDASSGACLHTLESYSSSVRSVAFSHDSTKLASASWDMTVKVWDASSGACLHTLNVGKTLMDLSFDSTNSCLFTEIGAFAIDSSRTSGETVIAEPERALCLGAGLSTDNTWIQHDGKNMLWIPSEYRPSCSTVYETTVGMGVGSGRVWLCNISTADVCTYR